jgi:hypothetical protein
MTPGQHTPDGDARLREVAVAVALRTGLLRRCPAHGEVYDPGQHDYQGACMVAGYLVNRGDPLVAPFNGNRVPLTDMLKTLCRDYGPACPRCSAAAGGGPAPGPDEGDHAPASPAAGRHA